MHVGLAAIHYDKGFDIDNLLVEVCHELAENGVRLGGLLQISEGGRRRLRDEHPPI